MQGFRGGVQICRSCIVAVLHHASLYNDVVSQSLMCLWFWTSSRVAAKETNMVLFFVDGSVVDENLYLIRTNMVSKWFWQHWWLTGGSVVCDASFLVAPPRCDNMVVPTTGFDKIKSYLEHIQFFIRFFFWKIHFESLDMVLVLIRISFWILCVY